MATLGDRLKRLANLVKRDSNWYNRISDEELAALLNEAAQTIKQRTKESEVIWHKK
jgi:hypothetical protein